MRALTTERSGRRRRRGPGLKPPSLWCFFVGLKPYVSTGGRRKYFSAGCFTGWAMCLVMASARGQGLPAYHPATQVTGVIRTWGSPQMGDLLKQYEAGFRGLQPGVTFDDDLKSTITAVAGVYTGRAEIGLLGRELWPTEGQAFASVAGRAPLVIDVATGSYDVPKATFALMVFVPKENPIAALSLEQLERVFGRGKRPVATWGELGLKGAWARRPVHLYGFEVENDKSQIFAQMVFAKGERWSCGLRESANAGSVDAGEAIVKAVAADPLAIGISNVHYAVDGVKTIAVSTSAGGSAVVASRESVGMRQYPLTRAVYMVLNADKGHPLSPATLEFMRFVLSAQGREAVVREGNYLPLTGAIAEAERKKVEAP